MTRAGGAKLAGREGMLDALRALKRSTETVGVEDHAALATLNISGRGGLIALLATHPALEERIARLESAR